MVGITIVYTGLIPSEITALGIKFGAADQNALLYILALLVSYFLLAFVVYAVSDFSAWKSAISEHYEELEEKRRARDSERDAEWLQVRNAMRNEIGSLVEERGAQMDEVRSDIQETGSQILKRLRDVSQTNSYDYKNLDYIGEVDEAEVESLRKFAQYKLLPQNRAIEAIGTISYLLGQVGKEAAAGDIESAITEHLDRWERSYENPRYDFSPQRALPPYDAFATMVGPPTLAYYLRNPIIFSRAIFEFILPLVVGAFAIIALVA